MTCPICSRDPEGEEARKYKPFCSKHCADVDLARWFNGTYTAPLEEDEDWSEAPGKTGNRDVH